MNDLFINHNWPGVMGLNIWKWTGLENTGLDRISRSWAMLGWAGLGRTGQDRTGQGWIQCRMDVQKDHVLQSRRSEEVNGCRRMEEIDRMVMETRD